MQLTLGGHHHIEGTVTANADGTFTISINTPQNATLTLALHTLPNGHQSVTVLDGEQAGNVPVGWASTAEIHELCIAGQQWRVNRPQPKRRGGQTTTSGSRGDAVVATMPGNILQVLAQPGEMVSTGQTVIVMESMKMELSLGAPCAGTVAHCPVTPGDKVEQGAVLLELAPVETN